MTDIRVAFANICQGMIYAQKSPLEQDLFSGWHPSRHADALAAFKPDICCLAEMVINTHTDTCPMIETFKARLGLPYVHYIATEKSWLVEGHHYGLAIFSRFPMTDQRIVHLPNPGLVVTRPNGDVWTMHDKVCQQVTIMMDGQQLQLTNLHSFPFHHFKRRLDEPDFAGFRRDFVQLVNHTDGPCLIAGDFNNKGLSIEQAFPEFFAQGHVHSTVTLPDAAIQKSHYTCQFEYILASRHFAVLSTQEDFTLSDHPTIVADLRLTRQ